MGNSHFAFESGCENRWESALYIVTENLHC